MQINASKFWFFSHNYSLYEYFILLIDIKIICVIIVNVLIVNKLINGVITIFEKDSISSRAIQHKFMGIGRLHRRAVENKIGATGVHKSQHMILMYLYRGKCQVSQKDIAKHFEISPAAVAVSLKKLESGGYIERNCAESDNRFNEIKITKKGEELVQYSRSVFEEVDEKAFEGISDTERETLSFLLDKITNNLKCFSGKEE